MVALQNLLVTEWITEVFLHGCAVARVPFEQEEAHQVEDVLFDTKRSSLHLHKTVYKADHSFH